MELFHCIANWPGIVNFLSSYTQSKNGAAVSVQLYMFSVLSKWKLSCNYEAVMFTLEYKIVV